MDSNREETHILVINAMKGLCNLLISFICIISLILLNVLEVGIVILALSGEKLKVIKSFMTCPRSHQVLRGRARKWLQVFCFLVYVFISKAIMKTYLNIVSNCFESPCGFSILVFTFLLSNKKQLWTQVGREILFESNIARGRKGTFAIGGDGDWRGLL